MRLTPWCASAACLLIALLGMSCGGGGGAPQPGAVQPPGTVPVNFRADDTANQTYAAADRLAWIGSFSFDETTRVLTRDTGWGGAFPLLWDDGPWDVGGHEPLGEIAGDHIWGVTVFIARPDEDTVFEYGFARDLVGTEFDWLWEGANGVFWVLADDTSAIDAPGATIPAFGRVDLRITLDVTDLDPSFSAFNPENGVEATCSAWDWGHVTLADDGQHGDLVAGDDLFTVVLSQSVGEGTPFPHAGLLSSGDVVSFHFVLGGVAYRVLGDAETQGAMAWTRAGGALEWSVVGVEPNGDEARITVP